MKINNFTNISILTIAYTIYHKNIHSNSTLNCENRYSYYYIDIIKSDSYDKG